MYSTVFDWCTQHHECELKYVFNIPSLYLKNVFRSTLECTWVWKMGSSEKCFATEHQLKSKKSKWPSLQTCFILKQVIYLCINYNINTTFDIIFSYAEYSYRLSKCLLKLIPSFNCKNIHRHTEVTLKQILSAVLALSTCHNTWKTFQHWHHADCRGLAVTVTLPHSLVLAQQKSHAKHTGGI